MFYTPFAELNDEDGIPGQEIVQEIQRYLFQQEWNAARLRAGDLSRGALEGLRYLQT